MESMEEMWDLGGNHLFLGPCVPLLIITYTKCCSLNCLYRKRWPLSSPWEQVLHLLWVCPGWTFVLPQVMTKLLLQPSWSLLLPLLYFWEGTGFSCDGRRGCQWWRRPLWCCLPGSEESSKYFCNNSKAVNAFVDLLFLGHVRLPPLCRCLIHVGLPCSFFSYLFPASAIVARTGSTLLSSAICANAFHHECSLQHQTFCFFLLLLTCSSQASFFHCFSFHLCLPAVRAS